MAETIFIFSMIAMISCIVVGVVLWIYGFLADDGDGFYVATIISFLIAAFFFLATTASGITWIMQSVLD